MNNSDTISDEEAAAIFRQLINIGWHAAILFLAVLTVFFLWRISQQKKKKLNVAQQYQQAAENQRFAKHKPETPQHQGAKPPVLPKQYRKMNRPCDGIQLNVDCEHPDSRYMPKK